MEVKKIISYMEVIIAHSSFGGGFFTNREGPLMSSSVGVALSFLVWEQFVLGQIHFYQMEG